MQLTELMTEEIIKLNLEGTTKDEVMDEMIALIDNTGVLSDKRAFKESLDEREQESSTGIGFGIAIPHGKSEAVTEARVAFGVKEEGIDWDSMDGEDARLVFMIAVPVENAGDDHLKILQQLSRKLMDEDFRKALLSATSKDRVLQLIKDM